MARDLQRAEAYQLQRLAFAHYTAFADALPKHPTTGKPTPTHADAAALWQLWGVWDGAREALRIIRKVPLPGTLKPGSRDGAGRPVGPTERGRRGQSGGPGRAAVGTGSNGRAGRISVEPLPEPETEQVQEAEPVNDGQRLSAGVKPDAPAGDAAGRVQDNGVTGQETASPQDMMD